MAPVPYIVVSGTIGAGKSTLLRGLGEAWPTAVTIAESRGRFVDAYYRDPTFAFPNQLDYSAQFLSSAIRAAKCTVPVIQERCALDVHQVFTFLMQRNGELSAEEVDLLAEITDSAIRAATPSHVVLLWATLDVLRNRIGSRGLEQESKIDGGYLEALLTRYDVWFRDVNVPHKLCIDTTYKDEQRVLREVLEWLAPM